MEKRRITKGAMVGRSTYKNKVQGFENNSFDVGVGKLLKSIKNYIQKTYKNPDDMVKTIQQMKMLDLQVHT